MKSRLACIGVVLVAVWATAASAGEWPQILGPTRSGHAGADERLAESWPASGPRVVWRRDVGRGYAGVAVAGDRVLLFHRIGDAEVLEALAPATGESLWADTHPTSFQPQVGGGDGPLCVPLVHDGRVIVFGAQGVLRCVDAATGKRLWLRDTHRDFRAAEGYFGAGSTPIVMGEHVVVNVGGSRTGAGIVAFSLATGATAWTKTSEPASYSAPVAVTVQGTPHVLMVTRYACLLLDPQTGAIRWQFPFGQRGPTVNAAAPVITSAGQLLVTAAYGVGSVSAAFDTTTFTKRWDGADALATQYCTPIVLDGHAYCIDGRDDVPPSSLACIALDSGRAIWREANFGYGTLLAADGKLLATKTDGELVLMTATPKGITVLARARPLAGTVRALPALTSGKLYLRDDTTLACLDIGLASHLDEGAHRPHAD